MIETGKYYVCFRKPDFRSEHALACSDLNGLVEAQVLQKKFTDTLMSNVGNLGGSSIDAGNYVILDMPIGSLQNILNIQNSLQAFVPFGIGSTIEGSYKALQVAHKFQKRLELYVPDQTEELLRKSEEKPQPDSVMSQATPEDLNEALLAELQAKSQHVNPEEFYGLISEFQHILQNFKINLPTIEMMQFTNPTAYGAILDVVNAASQFATLLMQSGVLNTDLGMMMQEQAAMEQQASAEQQGGEEGGDAPPSDGGEEKEQPAEKAEEPAKKKASKEHPIGTVKPSGTTFRVKTPDGWKYASRGLGQGEGGVAQPGTGAGTNTEGIENPQGPQIVMEQE
jgi:hypothetical protein